MKNNKTKNQIIGDNIKIAREEADLSQLDLAELLGFKTATAVSLIESGERKLSAENLEFLADKLNRTVDFFFGKEDKKLDFMVALRSDKSLNNSDKEKIEDFYSFIKNKKNR